MANGLSAQNASELSDIFQTAASYAYTKYRGGEVWVELRGESACLWDDSHPGPKLLNTETRDIDAVHHDVTRVQFHQPKQAIDQAAFSSTCISPDQQQDRFPNTFDADRASYISLNPKRCGKSRKQCNSCPFIHGCCSPAASIRQSAFEIQTA